MSGEGVAVGGLPTAPSEYDPRNEAQFRNIISQRLGTVGGRFQGLDTGLHSDEDATITGSWTFNNTISGDIDGDADTVDGYHGTALAALAENETVSGSWTFNNTISGDIDGDADTVDGYHGTALAALAENETVSGSWTFSNALVLGSDPGGGELLRVGGGSVRIEKGSTVGLTIERTGGAAGGWQLRITHRNSNEHGSLFFDPLTSTSDIVVRDTGANQLFHIDTSVGETGVQVGNPSSGHVANVVHHGTGSPSAVGVDGTLHTQDA